ncbi:hypothetical protein [Krasilnikovia sp. MM14-A1259]|uniref:hypothetical protein n=1 Tax=Krasilnikovia sp. MM14-A1259 TaxID=3373539 RepID=UPI00399C6FF5
MNPAFAAVWMPYQPDWEFATAAPAAVSWTEVQAEQRGLAAVLVTDRKGGHHGDALSELWAVPRRAGPRGR